MKKFHFNLETVLKVKKTAEYQAKKELEQVLEHLRTMEGHVAKLNGEKQEIEREWDRQQEATKEVHDYKVYRTYLRALSLNISEKQDEMMKLRNLEANKRQAYIKARTEKKTLENLKEKKFNEWKYTLNTIESKELDEQSMGKYIRKKGFVNE